MNTPAPFESERDMLQEMVNHQDELIESQAAEIKRHRDAALESTGLAGERIGTIAALRHEVADQAIEIERLRKYGLTPRERRFLANYLCIPKEEQHDA